MKAAIMAIARDCVPGRMEVIFIKSDRGMVREMIQLLQNDPTNRSQFTNRRRYKQLVDVDFGQVCKIL